MPKDDGGLDQVEDDHIRSYTVLAIDQFVKPSSFCPNGHIIEWTNEETGTSVCLLRAVNTDEMTSYPVCVVCGQRAVEQEPEDGPEGC